MLISEKAQFCNNSLVLKRDFNLNEDQLRKVFLLPHIVCSEAYVKAFQCKVLNFILYTNTKLHKIGYTTDDINSLFVSLNQRPYCTFFLTVCTQSFSGKILNFSFTLYQKKLFILVCKMY